MADKHTGLVISSAPHVNNPVDTTSIMRDVIIALIPSLVVSVYVMGIRALLLTIVCVAACVIFEWAWQKFMHRPQTIGDLSAAVTGVILAFNLPVNLPFWMAVVGCFIAIIITKQLFGGLGQNFANPAIVARVAMFVGFASAMTSWKVTSHMDPAIVAAAGDAMTGATPLGLLTKGAELPSYMSMFLGTINGSMGEVSAVALIIGGIYLLVRKIITWEIPVAFIASVAVFSLLMGRDPIFDVLAGGVMLGAIFMATDYVTSPINPAGKIIFGIGCGLMTMLIRQFGSYPEGVSFAILLMNVLTPHIDDWTRSKLNGVDTKKGGAK
ncbi:MAG: RnfABCDGE type electron transport complex subunit D [Firmicutes bacterium]|nr:RnfABCDGE type electron transport complex subunit D [Bacillota bacterium]